jgi:hypothetical protein
LANIDISCYFTGANPVFAIGQHPGSHEPFIQADRRILENGSDLDGELTLGVMARTLPCMPIAIETDAIGAAVRTNDSAIRPALVCKIANAIV